MKKSFFDTPIGQMIAIADDKLLYMLEFADKKDLESEMSGIYNKLNVEVLDGMTDVHRLLETEMKKYFSDMKFDFNIPTYVFGTEFQKLVWEDLHNIPYAATCSYLDYARRIGKPKAYRAVANAIGQNRLVIIAPCHRVIRSDGECGGYSGGSWRKEWLIKHEAGAN